MDRLEKENQRKVLSDEQEGVQAELYYQIEKMDDVGKIPEFSYVYFHLKEFVFTIYRRDEQFWLEKLDKKTEFRNEHLRKVIGQVNEHQPRLAWLLKKIYQLTIEKEKVEKRRELQELYCTLFVLEEDLFAMDRPNNESEYPIAKFIYTRWPENEILADLEDNLDAIADIESKKGAPHNIDLSLVDSDLEHMGLFESCLIKMWKNGVPEKTLLQFLLDCREKETFLVAPGYLALDFSDELNKKFEKKMRYAEIADNLIRDCLFDFNFHERGQPLLLVDAADKKDLKDVLQTGGRVHFVEIKSDSFLESLRTALRCDPDVIYLDLETFKSEEDLDILKQVILSHSVGLCFSTSVEKLQEIIAKMQFPPSFADRIKIVDCSKVLKKLL